MAQLLIRRFDRNSGNLGSFSAGDVIWVGSDDHIFSQAELVDPFRVIKILGLSESALRYLLLPVIGKRRAFGFKKIYMQLLTPGIVNTLTKSETWALFDRMEAR